jgi:beta-galactosidase/arabinogalactan endo-1,4-beta-galactosidase
MKTKIPLLALAFFAGLSAAVFAADATVTNKNSRTGPFILGTDVSWAPEDEADGAEYYDHGVRKDIFEILKDYKFNYIRLRLFVDPGAPDGYAAHRNEAFNDLAHVEAMAKRAKAASMGILLDIHYSDTWSSPGHQKKPLAWGNLDFSGLTKAVHDFTYKAIKGLKDNGTPANLVQIGNEVSDGMLFPDGRRSNFDSFAALVKAGIAGAREADPAVKIVLHHHLGRSNARMREWIDNFVRRGVDFDIIGMSCYAQAQEGDWKTNFDDLAMRYPDKGLLVVEYSARKRYLNDLMFNTPDRKGLGTFIWEPTRHREALFDQDGKNAGGGQASNFTTDDGINQGARLARTNAPAAANADSNEITYRRFGTNEAARAEWRKRRFGGRYNVNELMDLYPQMSKDYGNDKIRQAK